MRDNQAVMKLKFATTGQKAFVDLVILVDVHMVLQRSLQWRCVFPFKEATVKGARIVDIPTRGRNRQRSEVARGHWTRAFQFVLTTENGRATGVKGVTFVTKGFPVRG